MVLSKELQLFEWFREIKNCFLFKTINTKIMNQKMNPQFLQFAKSMRHTATDAEHPMWQVLRAKRFMNLKSPSERFTLKGSRIVSVLRL